MNYGYRYFSDQQDADEMQSANGLFQRRDSSPSNRSEMARQGRINSPSICSDGNQLDFDNRSQRNSPSICTDGSRSSFGNRSEMDRQIHRKSRSSYGNRYEVGRQRHRNSPSSCSDGRRFSYGNRYGEGRPRHRNSPTICSGSSRSDFGNRSEGVRQRRRNSPSLCSGSNRSSFGNRSEVPKELYHRYLNMGFSPEEARNALNNSSNKKRTSEYSNPDRVVAKRRNSYNGEEAFRTIVPGGVNDPLIKGLSKKAIQIYRHFLFEGLLPNEALQKTQECNGSDFKVISSKCSTSSSSQSIATKAGSNTSVAKKVNIETKNSSNTDMPPPPTKAAVSNVTRVAIMACSYPDYLLDREELHQLEESIVDEISAASGNDIKPHFEAVHFKDGMILVDCANIPTAQWLLEISGNITNWNGVPLCACLDSKVPSQNTVSIHFQRGGEKNPKQLLDLLMKQNEGINTALWTILHTRQTDRGGIVLTMIIDHDSLNYIRLRDFNLWYRFGYAHVRLHLQSTINNISQAADGKNYDNTSADENNIQIDDVLDGSEDIVDLTYDELITDIKQENEPVDVDNDKQEVSNEENDTEEVSNDENNTENEHVDGSKDIINLTEDELIIDIKQEKEHDDVHENCKNYEQEDNGEENSNVMDDNE